MAADITAAACLISMGAVLGKTSPQQLLVMGLVETAVYSANEHFAHHKLQVTYLQPSHCYRVNAISLAKKALSKIYFLVIRIRAHRDFNR